MAIVVGPLYVDCKRCGSRIKLSSKSPYDTFHWRTHRMRCLKKKTGTQRARKTKNAVCGLAPPFTRLIPLNVPCSHPLPRPVVVSPQRRPGPLTSTRRVKCPRSQGSQKHVLKKVTIRGSLTITLILRAWTY